MSIKIEKPEEGKITVELDNGHVEALNKIVQDYNIKDEQAAMGFMLAVLSQGEGRTIEIGDANFLPSDNIKKNSEG